MREAPTPAAVQTRINAALDAVAPTMAYLYDRWQDEREHEDFKEYEAKMREVAYAQGLLVVGATIAPFGFTFAITGAPEGALYRIVARRTSVRWERKQ